MNKLAHFEVIGRRGFYRPVCRSTFEQAVEMVAEAMRHARELGLQSLLINTTGFSAIAPPSIFGRHALAVKWAESAGPTLHVAVVTRPEMVDPQKIGVIMAQNRGASGDVFTSEAQALAWLDTRHTNV
jgi:hypothetical protein